MNKTIVIGVTGGIAAYKACELISRLKKKDYEVHVIMTKNAIEFISPLTLETLSHNHVSTDTFERPEQYDVHHIALAKKADLFVIIPATANVIAKLASGIADDMLTTTVLAYPGVKLVCPAMNTNMYENPVTQSNISKLKKYGYQIVEPATGLLACQDIGKGKLADIDDIEAAIEYGLAEKSMLNSKILVSAGASQEAIDPVRFISNHSSGKMGYALATEAYNLGAKVTLVKGMTHLDNPYGINVIEAISSETMYNTIIEIAQEYDYIIMCAAVADFKPKDKSNHKIKKKDQALNLELISTNDILKKLGEMKKPNQILCGFAMETENLIENAQAKLESKNLDMIVANSINERGAGFKNDTNIATIITENSQETYELMSKKELAKIILEKLVKEVK